MNYLGLIASASSQYVSPLIERQQQQQLERSQAATAERNHRRATLVQSQWISAITDDALRIWFGQPDCAQTLNSARSGLIFVMYGLIDEKNDIDTMNAIIAAAVKAQDLMAQPDCNPSQQDRISVALGMEVAIQALRAFKPIQIIQASFTFEERHPALVAHGKALEEEERMQKAKERRKTLTAKKHLVTFGAAAN